MRIPPPTGEARKQYARARGLVDLGTSMYFCHGEDFIHECCGCGFKGRADGASWECPRCAGLCDEGKCPECAQWEGLPLRCENCRNAESDKLERECEAREAARLRMRGVRRWHSRLSMR